MSNLGTESMIDAKASEIYSHLNSDLKGSDSEDIVSVFWKQWQKHQNQLYRYCLQLMNFNSTEAEDLLSQAMLKAWEKVQQFAGKIANFKAWLVRLTRNLCIDIIRERSRGACAVESINWVDAAQENSTTSTVASPESLLEKDEKLTEIRQAIAQLPQRQRQTFILHFYQDCSHQEIAQLQGISYDSVCKRISQARKLLKQKLSSYFLGEEGEVCATLPRSRQRAVSLSSQPTPPTCDSTSLTTSVEKLKKQPPDNPKQKDTANGSPTPECVAQAGEKPQKVKDAIEPKELESENICERRLVSGKPLPELRWPVKLPTSTKLEEVTGIGSAIAQLPQQQDIFYQNACQPNWLAGAILPEELSGAFIEEDRTNRDLSIIQKSEKAKLNRLNNRVIHQIHLEM